MPKKSKWLDIEFAPADFRNPNNVAVLLEVLPVVEEAAYRSMMVGEPRALLETVKALPFPDGCPHWPLTSFNVTYEFEQAPALTAIAELLWYTFAPSNAKLRRHSKEKAIGLSIAKEELCKQQAGLLKGAFIHAWRLYDQAIHEKICEAVYGFVNEVVTQTIWELPFSPKLPLTRLQLYRIATNPEESERKHRMKFGVGGRRSDYNLRWLPHNYSRAYRELRAASELYQTAPHRKSGEF